MDPRCAVGCREGLGPFVQLFRSVDTTGPIVAGALDAVRKLFLSHYFHPAGDPAVVEAYRALFAAASRCRFEATDLNQDEVALAKLTSTLIAGLRHPLAAHLTDVEVCTAVETAFRLCFQSRFSELFRQASCLAAVDMVALLFGHFKRLLRAPDAAAPGRCAKSIALPFAKAADGAEAAADGIQSTASLAGAGPFGLAALGEVLEFLCRMLEGAHTGGEEKVRCLAAETLGIILEQTHEHMAASGHMMRLLGGTVCRQLSALLGAGTSARVLRALVHPVGLLLRQHRRVFPAQFEYLLRCLVDGLRQRPSPNPKLHPRLLESKGVLLEVLLELVEDAQLLGDLYVHYECDARYAMTLSELAGCLCELAASGDPKAGGSEPTAMMAMQLLNRLLYQLAMDARAVKMDGAVSPAPAAAGAVSETRRLKGVLQEAAALYNRRPGEAVAFLQRHGLVGDPATPDELARFMRRTPGLDKTAMGEFLGGPDSQAVLQAYMADFDFSPGQTVDEALRRTLESFRLPGEAQQIDRIMEAFATAYYGAIGRASGQYASADAVYVLAFSTVMLNTDLYNKGVQHRMTQEEFVRNNRGINDGADFAPELLQAIYRAIAAREFLLPDVTPNAWQEVLQRAGTYEEGAALPAVGPEQYLQGVLALLFRQLLQCYMPTPGVLRSAELSTITFSGIDLLARVLTDLELHPMLAELIEALWQATGLPGVAAEPAPSSPAGGAAHAASPKARVIRHVARSESCGIVLRTLFGIVHGTGPSLRAGWRTFVAALLAFADAGLLSLEMVDPGLGEEIRRTTSLVVKPGTPLDSASGGSLFSTFSSYIVSSSAEGEAAAPAESAGDLETRRLAVQAVREACQLDRILRETRFFHPDSLLALLQALSQALQGRPAAAPEGALVVLLELMVYVAWQNRDRLEGFWDTLSGCLRDLAKAAQPKLCEHATMGLGRICLWLSDTHAGAAAGGGEKPYLQLYLQVLCHVPPDTFALIGEAGVALALQIALSAKHSALHSPTLWPHYFTLLSQSSRLRQCDASTYGLLLLLVPQHEAEPLWLPMEFFSDYVDLLVAFVANSITAAPGQVTPLSLASKETVAGSPTAPEDAVRTAGRALDSLSGLQARLLAAGHHREALHLHAELAKLGVHPARLLRQHALGLLQRLALSMDFAGQEALLQHEFADILLPLLRASAAAGDETQVRAASILTRALLHNLPLLLPARAAFARLWRDVLAGLLQQMQGPSDMVRESVPESIKNMLMVMATSHEAAFDDAFWRGTWALLEPVIPRLRQDLNAVLATTAPCPEPAVPGASKDAVAVVEDGVDGVHVGVAERGVDQEVPDTSDAADGSDAASSSPTDAAPSAPAEEAPGLPAEATFSSATETTCSSATEALPSSATEAASSLPAEMADSPVAAPANESTLGDRPTTMFDV